MIFNVRREKMYHTPKKYRLRWCMVWTHKDGTLNLMHRIRISRTAFMLDMLWERWRYGPGNYRMLYIVYPWFVDVNDTNWKNPKWIERHNARIRNRKYKQDMQDCEE